MFTCETVKANGTVVEGSKEEFKDVDAVIQNLIETAAPEYSITVAFWLARLDTDMESKLNVPNGLQGDVDRWTNIPWLV